MSSLGYLAGCILSLTPAFVVACATTSSPMEDEAQTAYQLKPNEDQDSAGDAVAVARCHREETCGNVGDGRAYASRPACEAAMREETRGELPACGAFSSVVLDQCLVDIRALRCASNLSTVENMESCRATRLCGG
jgi:hypothetical protein